MTTLQDWLDALGQPERYSFSASLTRLCVYPHIPTRDPARTVRVEMWLQANGPGTAQRVCKVFPEGIDGPLPAVVVPFYYPEAMLALDPATGEKLASFAEIPMLLELAVHGYAAATADAYHLTYRPSDKARDDFSRWQDSADALHRDHPHWTGMGKLVADTALLTDALAEDPRVDAHRIGIAGHSLGGKMAFYAGCLDARISVMLCSDFGIGWTQTNWRDDWYWGARLDTLVSRGMDHAQLAAAGGAKPLCLLAGQYDDADSLALLEKVPEYAANTDGRLLFLHHASGHRPPRDAREQGYRFLDRWLME